MAQKIIGCLFILLLISCQEDLTNAEPEKEVKRVDFLPLVDLTPSTMPDNWQTVGKVVSNPFTDDQFATEAGKGIIVCTNNGDHLNLGIEHGDLELEVDFMVPKGSNSGIYFQGRYEVQILDSWNKREITSQDCGSIYESYNEQKKEVIHPGSVPTVNASRAPGLWQTYRILFRAPTFDESGKKLSNARFDHVYLNGQLIQENVEVSLPTRAHMLEGEAALGPLMIQGDHGQVAFRNIKYKKIGTDSVGISNLNYSMYDTKVDYIPDFDTMTVFKSGPVESFDGLEDLAGQKDGFCLVFDATISIPRDGDYLFTTVIDDGGDLYIDDQLVVHNLGEPGIGTETGLIHLTAGQHTLKLTYFEEVWSAIANVFIEGPEIPKHTLACTDVMTLWRSGSKRKELHVDATGGVELVRGYVPHINDTQTHAVSIGDPLGTHYSYDLVDGTILRAWKGSFADVTNMWQNRGQSQLLLTRNAPILFEDGVMISSSANFNQRPKDYKNLGYEIRQDGRPVFKSSLGDIQISDSVIPTQEGSLKRTIQLSDGDNVNLKAASAKAITKIEGGLLNIGSQYYLKIPESVDYTIRTRREKQDLIIPISNTVNYEIIW